MKEATDLLGSMRQQQSANKVDSLADEASRLAQEERDQAGQHSASLRTGHGIAWSERRTRKKLADDREKLANDLGGLEKNLQDTARELATNNQSAASTKLREALGDMQQSDLRARIQRGADWMRRGIDPNANGMEPEIAAGMQRLEKELHDAQQAMGAAPQQGNDSQQGIETALNRVERLRNQLGGLSRDGQGRQQGTRSARPGQGKGSRAARGRTAASNMAAAIKAPGAPTAARAQESAAATTAEPTATHTTAAEPTARCTAIWTPGTTRRAEGRRFSPTILRFPRSAPMTTRCAI